MTNVQLVDEKVVRTKKKKGEEGGRRGWVVYSAKKKLARKH